MYKDYIAFGDITLQGCYRDLMDSEMESTIKDLESLEGLGFRILRQ